MDILKTLGQNIKKYRAVKKLSQEDLSEITGLHRTYIGSTERGERNISLRNIEKIAKALDVSVEDLVRGEGEGQ